MTTAMLTADTAALPEVRRSTGSMRQSDLLAVVGAAAASVSVTSLLFTQIAPFSGAFGFVVVAFALYLGIFALLVSLDESGPVVRDRVVSVLVHSVAVLLLTALVFIIGYTIFRGLKALPHPNFYTKDMSTAGPLEPLSAGGILHAMVGTLEQITIALVITVPLGLTCALFLNEVPGRLARFVRTVVEAMTALPSIVAGLFIYATFILIFGFGKSGLAASLALSVLMLPIIIRAADVVLRLVPGSLKEASYAMGAGQWRTVWHVTLPTARSGLTTAVILGCGRGIGETAPVLLTAGFTANMNTNPFHDPQVSLPLAAFQFVRSPQPTMIQRGFGTAALLMLLVLFLFILARIIGGRAPGNLTPRQAQRAFVQSQQYLMRFDARAFAAYADPPHGLIKDPGSIS